MPKPHESVSPRVSRHMHASSNIHLMVVVGSVARVARDVSVVKSRESGVRTAIGHTAHSAQATRHLLGVKAVAPQP